MADLEHNLKSVFESDLKQENPVDFPTAESRFLGEAQRLTAISKLVLIRNLDASRAKVMGFGRSALAALV